MKKDIIGELFGKHRELTIKAKDFTNELTSHNVIKKDLNNQAQISQEYVENNKVIRDILLQRGVKPKISNR